MKRLDAKGFGVIEGLLILVIVGLIGGVGYYVWNQNQDSSESGKSQAVNTVQPTTYNDTANKFTFQYPSDWLVSYPEKTGKDGPVQPDPDWSKVSRGLNIKPVDDTEDNLVVVAPGCETLSSDGKDVTVLQDLKDRKDQFHTQEELKMNGYEGFYDKTDFKGDAESYLDHEYFVTDGKSCVTFSFRENYYNDSAKTSGWDDSKNVPAYKSIVESIKFI